MSDLKITINAIREKILDLETKVLALKNTIKNNKKEKVEKVNDLELDIITLKNVIKMNKEDYIEAKNCLWKIQQKEKEIQALKLQVHKIMVEYDYTDYNAFINYYRLN